jgi:hypothetical protein
MSGKPEFWFFWLLGFVTASALSLILLKWLGVL